MPPDIDSMTFFLILLICVCSSIEAVTPRSSCRAHFLANIRDSKVLPIALEDGSVANVFCDMSANDDDEVIKTEIQSGLSRPVTLSGRKSVNYQIQDLFWIRETVKTSDCSQEITVSWDKIPEEQRGSVRIVSLLNETITVDYNSERPIVIINLEKSQAGIRHVFVSSTDKLVTLSASPLICSQPIVTNTECLFEHKATLNLVERNWNVRFAFRTDKDATDFLTFDGPSDSLQLQIRNNFFIVSGYNDSKPIGFLTDGNWHSVHLEAGAIVSIDDHVFKIDNPISRFSIVKVHVTGEILLLDQQDLRENCASQLQETDLESAYDDLNDESSMIMCTGCDCSILTNYFKSLPSTACEVNDYDTFHLLRDFDKLSFFHIPDDEPQSRRPDVRSAMAYKSDSDAGLLMFGYWNYATRGRWQIHYRGSLISSVYCEHDGEEEDCKACTIRNKKGLGEDEWHRAAFYSSDNEHFLISDDQICRLHSVAHQNNISIAELYSVPNVVNSGGIFIGGTYFEMKRSGLYQTDVTYKFFENTREKMPSLRGCIKDVFVRGTRVDMALAYENQRKQMLVDESDLKAFSIVIGCLSCTPSCDDNVRCRTPSPYRGAVAMCDCSDVFQTNLVNGNCLRKLSSPIPLSTKFLNAVPVIITLPSTKAVIQNIWIQFKIPAESEKNLVVAEFNNHREMLFRVYLTPDGRINVQSHPHDIKIFEPSVYQSVDTSDDRVHLLTVRRRTPVGTRPTNRKYELIIDGSRYEFPDHSRSALNNITLYPEEGAEVKDSVVIHDIGVGYDHDEHIFQNHKTNRIHQVDIHKQILPYLSDIPAPEDPVGIVDTYLWQEEPEHNPSTLAGELGTALTSPLLSSASLTNSLSNYPNVGDIKTIVASPHGTVVEYTPDIYQPQFLLPVSARVIFYSIIVCALLLLLVLLCFCCYCCILRKRGTSRSSTASDRVNMLRNSPDYPVKLRKDYLDTASFHDDSSIGTDDTDLNAYRDIHSHRVKIYRESMVSILVPSLDHTQEAAIVKRRSVNEQSPPVSPSLSASPAPLVDVGEDIE